MKKSTDADRPEGSRLESRSHRPILHLESL
jgi:hypothetical protein